MSNFNEDDKLSEVGKTLGINLFQLKEKYQNIIENDNLNPNVQILSSSSSYTQTLSTKDLSQSFSSEFSSKPVLINQDSMNITTTTTTTTTTEIDDKTKEAINIQKTLDNYKICKTCIGKGYTSYIYNHRVMEMTCEECDGDSIVISSSLKDIILERNSSSSIE